MYGVSIKNKIKHLICNTILSWFSCHHLLQHIHKGYTLCCTVPYIGLLELIQPGTSVSFKKILSTKRFMKVSQTDVYIVQTNDLPCVFSTKRSASLLSDVLA